VSDAKAYPTDELGARDDGDVSTPPKPCAKRITHENLSKHETAITWCTQPDGHAGQCSGPLPSILEPNDLGPGSSKRRRW
jgi:hypothetical protein